MTISVRYIKIIKRLFLASYALFKIKKKVDFVIVGVQKGGTTALDVYLRFHPELCMAEQKEVHFFDNDLMQKLPIIKKAIYHSYFINCDKNKIWGESTPIYSFWETAPRRIFEYNPSMKIIIVLRNPIERAYSHWNMERSRGKEKLGFSEAIRTEIKRSRIALPEQHRIYSYVTRGFYSEQLRKIYRFFPFNHVLVIKNDDLRRNPRDVLNIISRFLGVPPIKKSISMQNVHSLPYERPISSNDKEFLRKLYKNDIKEVEKMLGWDCNSWLL